MTYQTAIYKLDKRWKKGRKILQLEENELPNELPFEILSNIFVKAQMKCFKDENLNNENKDRINALFLEKKDPTIAIAISIFLNNGDKDLLDFNDIGLLTLQKTPINALTGTSMTRRSKGSDVIVINEVCRAVINKENLIGGTPIPNIMKVSEKFIHISPKNELYLYVEKNPEHGSGDILLQYYGSGYKGKGGYGFELFYDDENYYYMKKNLSNKSIGGKRKTKKRRNKKRKTKKIKKKN